jgi:hypothetical protein
VASHGSHIQTVDENVQLGNAGGGIKLIALAVGIVLLVLGVVLGFFVGGDEHALANRARFYHAYLVGIAFCLSIGAAGLFFTLMQHMVKVGWSVNVRRVPEALAASLPFLGILAIPLLIPVWGDRGGELYPWAVPHDAVEHHASAEPTIGKPLDVQLADAAPEAGHDVAAEHQATVPHGDNAVPIEQAGHKADPEVIGAASRYDWKTGDHLQHLKAPWLNKTFFTIRIIFYFAVWTVLAWYFVGQSRKQDSTGDINISKRLALVAPVGIISFALTLTFAAFDLIMSLDYYWFSTIFGVYIFAGGMISMFATCVISYRTLQSKGFLRQSVTTEHYHDLGKFMFAFVFFWGYIAFSQFMLQWYASLPEEIFWWARRGVTSADLAHNTIGYRGEYAGLSIALLFGHFVIPFAYLISRHIKRSREALLVGAAWMLVAHFVDMYWLIMPEWNNGEFILDVAVLATAISVIALFVFYFVHQLGRANLRPVGDPRTPESLAFVNM